MKNINNYLKELQDVKNKEDFSLSSNFDESYKAIIPKLSSEQISSLANRYPDYSNNKIAEKIKLKFNLKNIVLGAGSEDLIIKLNKIIIRNNWKVGVLVPCFYRITETLNKWQSITRKDLLEKNITDLDVVWICNPNPLDGQIYDKKTLRTIIKNNKKTIFIIDETAIFFLDDWKDQSFLGKREQNVLVVTSFSKLFGLSGLRAGFASGNPKLIELLRAKNNTFPFTSVTEMFVESVLENMAFYDAIRQKIKRHKNELEKIISNNKKFVTEKSCTNCIFLRSKNSSKLHDILLKKGAIGLDLGLQNGVKQKGWVRLTVHSSERLHQKLMSLFTNLSGENINETKN